MVQNEGIHNQMKHEKHEGLEDKKDEGHQDDSEDARMLGGAMFIITRQLPALPRRRRLLLRNQVQHGMFPSARTTRPLQDLYSLFRSQFSGVESIGINGGQFNAVGGNINQYHFHFSPPPAARTHPAIEADIPITLSLVRPRTRT